jgi:hypothetical protein
VSRVDRLVKRYEGFVSLPWEQGLAGAQRVWFVQYDKTDERRIWPAPQKLIHMLS